MKHDSKIIFLQIVLFLKLLTTALVLFFPQALLGLIGPLGMFSPLLVGAIAYSGIPKCLLTVVTILMIIVTVLLVTFSICIIVNPKYATYFAYVLVFCYGIEGISCVLSLFSGSLLFANLVGLIFNTLIVKLLWTAKKVQDNRTGHASLSCGL